MVVKTPSSLVWDDKAGIGYYPAHPENVYDKAYFDKYVRYAGTPMGRALTEARIAFVEEHVRKAEAIDIGIGCGQFVEERMKTGAPTYGCDVNPSGVEWLAARRLYRDPFQDRFSVMTFWDSLEHIDDPLPIVKRAGEWIFLSIPIFTGLDHVFASRHFRPDEHYWYFRRDGLIDWMRILGFRLVRESRFEVDLGREDIGTFSFRRRT